MKIKHLFKTIAATLLAASALTFCNVNDDIRGGAPPLVRITAGIVRPPAPAFRIFGTAWAAGDAIGVS